jgi:hypothetical protein
MVKEVLGEVLKAAQGVQALHERGRLVQALEDALRSVKDAAAWEPPPSAMF